METTYRKILDKAKTILKGKFISMSANIKKRNSVRSNNIIIHLNLLE